MKTLNLPRILGMFILFAAAVGFRHSPSDPLHFVIATVTVIVFWALHSIQFSISNIRTLIIILLVFAVPFFLIGQLPFFSSQGAVSGPWTGESFNPSQMGRVELSHEVALQLYFDHYPTEDERYFKTASITQTSDGLRYQIQLASIDESLMPETKKWVVQNLKSKNIRENAHIIENWLQKDFRYSLEPGTLTSSHPLDEFLFERKEGYCQHYAAALTTLLKLNGIRARIAVGFVGGSWNRFSRRLTYEMADSHAWVEAFDPDTNAWVRFDPTAWVSTSYLNPHSFSFFDWRFAFVFLICGIGLVLFFIPEKDPVLALLNKINQFEKKRGWSPFGLTISERLERVMQVSDPKIAPLMKDTLFHYQKAYFSGDLTRETQKQFLNSFSKWRQKRLKF